MTDSEQALRDELARLALRWDRMAYEFERKAGRRFTTAPARQKLIGKAIGLRAAALSLRMVLARTHKVKDLPE
jgi:hypothetical protein